MSNDDESGLVEGTHRGPATPSGIPALAATILLAFAMPTAVLIGSKAFWFSLAIGSVAWVVAVAIKFAIISVIPRSPSRSYEALWRAVFSGGVSALTELGVAALWFIVSGPLKLWELVAFGIGAASAEIFYVIIVGIAKSDRAVELSWVQGARESLCVRYALFIERSITTVLHIASRGLVYLGLTFSSYWVVIIAFLSFGTVDAVATLGHIHRWNWFDPTVCLRFYTFVLVISLMLTTLFATLALITL